MSDKLDVPNFKSKSQIKFTSVNNDAPRKITTSKGNKKYVLIPLTVLTAITIMIGKSALYEHSHKQVEHSGDRYDEGILIHTHELDEECFIRDYKFVNPSATNEDILTAFKNGEFEEYQSGNKGYIEKVDALQDDEIEQSVDYYNDECVKFADEYQEREEIMKNQR